MCSPVAISIKSIREGRLLDVNEAYLNLIGYDRQTALGKTTIDLDLWSNTSEYAKFVKRIKEQKSLHNPEYKLTNRSGEERVTLAFYELIDVENEPVILSMFHDITEQKKAQRALQASEEKYRNFVEQSIEGIWFLAFDDGFQRICLLKNRWI